MDREMEPHEAASEWAATPEILQQAAAGAEEVCELIRFDSRDSKLTLLSDFEAFGCLPEWLDSEDAAVAILEAFGGGRESGLVDSLSAQPDGERMSTDVPHDERFVGTVDESAQDASAPAVAAAGPTAGSSTVAAGLDKAAASAGESGPDPDVATQTPQSVFAAALRAQGADDIVLVAGKEPRFYSRDFMTDAYANWAALSADGDDAATFAYCVREDSRVYPRPMIDTSLDNPPFNLGPERLAELFAAVNGMSGFEDIRTTSASNGDVYYYSTDYLTPGYAASLAEWYSVEQLEF